MPSHAREFALATCLIVLAAPPSNATAQATFVIKSIAINGNTDFDATSINAAGTVVGTLYGNNGATPRGIEISGGTATTLPSPGHPFTTFFPRVINDVGDILGYAYDPTFGLTDMFLLQSGGFNAAYSTPVVEPSNASGIPPLPLSLTKNRLVSFNDLISFSGPIVTNYGLPPHYQHVPRQNFYTQVVSVSSTGVVAGVAFSQGGNSAVYTGKGTSFTTIKPPNATSVTGGYINDANTVAGSFVDNNNAWHGFTYAGGNITVFDMPQPHSVVTVTGINRRGRVVGVYADATGEKHGFLWNGSTTYSFGKYPGARTVLVAISSKGGIVVSVQDTSQGNLYRSENVSCSGMGC